MTSQATIHRQATRVTVITVAFNSVAVLRYMLPSVPPGASVIVVNNASDDRSELRELLQQKSAVLIENPSNRGFGAACNLGARQADTEFLLFLNPDAVLLPLALEHLVEAADRYPTACAFNPRIENASGEPFFKNKSHLLPRSDWAARTAPTGDHTVKTLTGAALFVRADAFHAVGGFDEQLFLYYEDDDLALRLARQCGQLMYARASGVRHLGGMSSGQSQSLNRFKAWHMGFSRMHVVRKHRRTAGVLHALLDAVGRALVALPPMSKPKRTKRWAYLQGTLSALTKPRS
jgi:GT2 family glycosyltransferase